MRILPIHITPTFALLRKIGVLRTGSNYPPYLGIAAQANAYDSATINAAITDVGLLMPLLQAVHP